MYLLTDFVLHPVYAVPTCVLSFLRSGGFLLHIHVCKYIQLRLEFLLMFVWFLFFPLHL